MTHHGPHPSLERVAHHGLPPPGSPLPLVAVTDWYAPSLWVRRGLPPLEKDDSPLHSSSPRKGLFTTAPSPLHLVPVADWYAPTPWVHRGSPSPWCLLQTGMTPHLCNVDDI